MHLVVHAATYGTVTHVRNTLALFLRQQLREGDTAHLLIWADDGLFSEQSGGEPPLTWTLRATSEWIPLATKYKVMLEDPISRDADAVILWDVDDIYLPHYLSTHASALEGYMWSHSSKAYSTYKRNPSIQHPEIRDISGRRYKGMLGVRMDLLLSMGGWPKPVHPRAAAFDKLMLGDVAKHGGIKGDPADYGPPAYVYNWSSPVGSHVSAHIKTDVDGKRWYPKPKIHEPALIGELTPQLDAFAVAVLSWFED